MHRSPVPDVAEGVHAHSADNRTLETTTGDAMSIAMKMTSSLRRSSRPLGMVAAPLVALLVWLAADPLAGIDLAVRRGAGAVQNLGPVDVIIAALAAGLAAWGLRAVLDRVSDRSRTVWTAVAVAVLLVSVVGPLTGAMTVTATIVLECMHVAVGASLIAALAPGVTST
jgi:hypothetical protein